MKKLFEWIYPSGIYCIACEDLIDKSSPYSLCDRCAREMNWIRGRACSRCGKALGPEWRGGLCADCRDVERRFGKGLACVSYEGRAMDVVRGMKYKERSYIASHIAEIMTDRLIAGADPDTGEMERYDYIIPVPMYKRKERKRGYNQSALIANAIASNLNMGYQGNALIRNKPTPVMSGLGKDLRRLNLEGAFTVTKGFRQLLDGASILLVDDVFTTGSTADECAATLLETGAAKVDIIVFAAGANYAAKQTPHRSGSVIASPSQLRAKGPT